jgi:hypothetical protein
MGKEDQIFVDNSEELSKGEEEVGFMIMIYDWLSCAALCRKKGEKKKKKKRSKS